MYLNPRSLLLCAGCGRLLRAIRLLAENFHHLSETRRRDVGFFRIRESCDELTIAALSSGLGTCDIVNGVHGQCCCRNMERQTRRVQSQLPSWLRIYWE